MTNNMIDQEPLDYTDERDLAQLIKARVQGRDIEKLFDQFIEEASDAVIYDLGLAKLARNDDDLNDMIDDMIDYTIEQILARFGYKFVGKEE